MRIAVSACLLGEACRYDGRSKPCARVQELAVDGHELVPVCPEVAGGLPTPRTPCEIVRAPWIGSVEAPAADDGTPSFLASEPHRESNGRSGETEHGRSDSASHDGTFSGTLVPGWGIAAAAFRDAGIAVIDETADFSRLSRM